MTPIKNESGLHPQGVAVLVYAWEPELLSSILEIPASVRESLQVLENRVTVIEVGPHAWHDEPQPRARVGDVVLIQKHSGFAASGADGKLYKIVNCRDIFCKIDTQLFAKAKAAKERAA